MLLFALMLAFGAIPGKAQALTAAMHDKLLHFLVYGLLSALVYRGLTMHLAMRCAGTLLVIAALGALDEAVQALLPYRQASWLDWTVDMMAALTCVVLLSLHSALAQRSTIPEVRPGQAE